jgi:uncharacterized protein YjbI with pentapeptide repeats
MCSFVGANLRGADLRGASLAGCDLSGADLRGVRFTYVNTGSSNGQTNLTASVTRQTLRSA